MPPGGSSHPDDARNTSSNNKASSSQVPINAATPGSNNNPVTCSICKTVVNPGPNDTCGICYEPFSTCSLLHPCHHIFDYECISEWLTTLFNSNEWTPAKTTCPLCRGIIDTIERSNPVQSLGIDELFRGSRDVAGGPSSRPIEIDNRGRDRYLQLLYRRRQAASQATGIRPYTGNLARRGRTRSRRFSEDFGSPFDEDEYNYGGGGSTNNDYGGSDWVSGAVQESPEDNIIVNSREADYAFEDVLEDVGNMELLRVLEREVYGNSGESGQSNGQSSTTYGTPAITLTQGLEALIDAPVPFVPSTSPPGNIALSAARQVVPRTPLTEAEILTAERTNEGQASIDNFVSSIRTAYSPRNVAPHVHGIPRQPTPTAPAPNVVTRATAERRNDLVQALLDSYSPPAPSPYSTADIGLYTRLIPARRLDPTNPAPTGSRRVTTERRINGELIFTDVSASSQPMYSSTGNMIPLNHRHPRLPVLIRLPPVAVVEAIAGSSTVREEAHAADAVVSDDEADGSAAAYEAFRAESERRRTRRMEYRDWIRRNPDFV